MSDDWHAERSDGLDPHDMRLQIKWFGEAWNQVCMRQTQIAIPAGRDCPFCLREIEQDAQGFAVPHLGGGRWSYGAYHRECFANMVLGREVSAAYPADINLDDLRFSIDDYQLADELPPPGDTEMFVLRTARLPWNDDVEVRTLAEGAGISAEEMVVQLVRRALVYGPAADESLLPHQGQ